MLAIEHKAPALVQLDRSEIVFDGDQIHCWHAASAGIVQDEVEQGTAKPLPVKRIKDGQTEAGLCSLKTADKGPADDRVIVRGNDVNACATVDDRVLHDCAANVQRRSLAKRPKCPDRGRAEAVIEPQQSRSIALL